MIDRLLESLVRFALTRSRVILFFGLASLLLSGYAFTVPLDFSFSGVMDRDHPEVERYFSASKEYGLGGILPLLLEGPEEELDEAVADVRNALADLPEIRSLGGELPKDWLVSHAPWLVDAPDFDRWVAATRAPTRGDESLTTRDLIRSLEARFGQSPPRGARLVQIVMARDTFEMALDADDFPTIRRTVLEVLGSRGVTARFAGMPAIVTQEQEATIERMRVLGPLSLVLVLTILFTVERRPLMLASIALPMLLAVGCTLGLVGLIAGEFTLMESIFSVIVFGLGIDFAVHLLLRFREERTRGFEFDASMRSAFLGTGRGVFAGALTTAGAFFVLAFAPDPVFYRLGLSGGLGLSLCLLFLLLMLPAEWAWLEGRSPAPRSKTPSTGKSLFGEAADLSARRSKAALLVGGALFLAGGFQIRSLSYETNLEHVFSREIDAVKTARRIHEGFGVHPGVWLVPTADLEEARKTISAFEADPLFERTESAAALLPSDTERRQRILDELVADLGRSVGGGASTHAFGDKATGALAPMDPSTLLVAAQAIGPPRLDTLPESIRDRLIGPGGEILVLAFTKGATLDSAVASRERRIAQAIHPSATSMSAIYEALIGTDRPWMPPIVAAVALFIAGILRLDLGSFRYTVLALVPAVFSLVVTLGLLAAFGFSLNTVTLVAVPLLLGLGVDDGIHVIHRMLEQPESPIERVVDSVAKSIALTTATTCGSVALLLFSRHPGMESVAILLVIGLPMALVATVTLVPALVVALGMRGRA